MFSWKVVMIESANLSWKAGRELKKGISLSFSFHANKRKEKK